MAFKSAGYAWRLFCGAGVIEANLRTMVERAGARRAFVVCSPSITARTDIVTRIEAVLGETFAGVFDRIEKDSTFASVLQARDAANDSGADLLIAVGGGSVIVANRGVAVFLAEAGDPFEIMTQYPADGRPYSPRLMAPKLPIINIPTTPTSAMNRAGSGLKNPDLDRRMEYFDPKTRPQAVLIDDDVLMTTPEAVLRSTATTVFLNVVASLGQRQQNPLVEGDHAQAFQLAHAAFQKLGAGGDNADLRRNLCLAAFLQNRAEDDGRPVIQGGPFSGDYAVATALHLKYPAMGQGEASSVLHAPALRLARDVEMRAARHVAEGLGVWRDSMALEAAVDAVAIELSNLYAAAGMPARLRDVGVSKDDFADLAAATVKNFNARTSATSSEERVSKSRRLLEAAW